MASHWTRREVSHRWTTASGAKAVISGVSPSKRSTSIRAVWATQHCASFDVPLSRVSTLGLQIYQKV